MPLFQQSVIRKHIESFDEKHIEEKWLLFKSIFHSPEKQSNIRNSKEEQYQEGFLRDLFVQVLGYTINPEPNFNLLTEQKNVNNSKKADGAIVVDGKAIGVIELKGTETTDLNKIEIQAFGYKNNQPGCNYVITSNFEKLRFYIDNTTQQEEFNLFTLTKAQFELLYACLAWESIKNNTPTQILNESVSKENIITKSLYKDYSEFKRALFANMVELNPQFDKLVLFKKTQKLLDRFLFIFFAEDRGLLPTNLIFRINKEWENIIAQRISVSLFDRYKMYFNDLNVGAKVTLPAFGKKTGEAITAEFEIFAYNGGLFVPDEILDNIRINDTLLHSYTQKMSHYNFESDVDVNILGHIFENSLNEIDEIKSEIEGNILEKTKTRRKKDGVFYTPKYITKYIVDNTIGKLCAEKKEEIKLLDEDYTSRASVSSSSSLSKAKKKALLDKLTDYRNWLLDLTICDPACGSGAFLNQALEFLIAEHRYVDELQAKLLGDSLILSDIENSILERNIYGVDLNDESVEIAKLSLWLRTAQKGRKLNSLNNNIKCGNSLIDDPAVAGDKAFSWEKEFPEVFAKGGFDVVIGNPPYVNLNEFPKQIHNYLETIYKSIHTGYNDLMYYFLFKGILILKKNGVFGIITSNYFIGNSYAKGIRNYLSNYINHLVNFEKYLVFQDANVHTAIIFAQKNTTSNKIVFESYKSTNPLTEISNSVKGFISTTIERSKMVDNWIIADGTNLKLIGKLTLNNTLLGEISEIVKGSESGKNEIFTVNTETIEKYEIEKKVLKKCIKNSDVKKYVMSPTSQYLIYADNDFSRELYPNAYRYLEEHKELLLERRGPRTGEYKWWRLHRPSDKEVFDSSEKILVPYRAEKNRFAYDSEKLYNNGGDVRAIRITNKCYDTKFITAILNSTLIDWFYGFIGKPKGNSREYFNKPLSEIPIIKVPMDIQKNISMKVDILIEKYNEVEIVQNKYLQFIKNSKIVDNFSGKLEKWYELGFADFIKELNKAIKAAKGTPLTKKDEFDWMDLFEENKKKALELKSEIDMTDKEIDRMVYELYGLNEEEIKIVEES